MTLTYTKKVLDLLRNPKNMGQIIKPDGVAVVGNRVCGDVMKLYLRIGRRRRAIDGKEEEYVKNIKFQTLGCPAAIATSSILTEIAKGKTLTRALKISNREIVEELDGLPRTKLHCSVLAAEALKKAIRNYQGNEK
ncbi:MAG: iron-sulfur cluster assembly scaffold protein [Candidatus Pacebacteria bacterium]|nr:iron-sulfur cluster assembly scaffold protein [Candidatus Paceibacterota bacterium]